jgi:pimeloyl-ACP methyl ester carboxylesterase
VDELSVVFVHGIEDDFRTWSPLAGCLTRWQAWALDLPWRAGNDYGWRWHGSPASWLAAGLASTPDVLVGHSFGANAVLAHLASGRDPQPRVAVLLNPFFRPADAPASWRTFERSRAMFERQIADGMRVRLSGRAALPPPDILADMLAKASERIGPVGFLAVFDEYLASGHQPLSQVAVPTLVIGGARDPGLARSYLELLAAGLPRGAFTCEAGYDHFCHRRRSAQVASTIENFVAMSGVRNVVS